MITIIVICKLNVERIDICGFIPCYKFSFDPRKTKYFVLEGCYKVIYIYTAQPMFIMSFCFSQCGDESENLTTHFPNHPSLRPLFHIRPQAYKPLIQ